MTITVTKDRETVAVYTAPIPAEWIRQMRKAGYKVKEEKDGAAKGR
ncbi:MAG: hypothetical protein IKZ82_06275 [Clostridia bacterium]|nr:hypothetical protein [Clostridia bacterium]